MSDTCPTCGSPVEVVSGDEGTCPRIATPTPPEGRAGAKGLTMGRDEKARADLAYEAGRLRGFADNIERGIADNDRLIAELRAMADRLVVVRSTPEAGAARPRCTCRAIDGPLGPHPDERTPGCPVHAPSEKSDGPASLLFALAEGLEARAQMFSRYADEAPNGTIYNYYTDIATEYRYIVQLVRDYATREARSSTGFGAAIGPSGTRTTTTS